MEVQTEVPQTGTRLRIDNDRQFDRPTGDSVIRVQAQSPDGGQVSDVTLVEVSGQESNLISFVLRQVQNPTQKTQELLATEVQAAFPSRLLGRDANQIAQLVARTHWLAVQQQAGIGDENQAEKAIQQLAERFERAAAKSRTPYGTNGSQEQSQHSSPSRGTPGR